MAEVKREYYKSGELKSEVFVINGKYHGEYKKYYENGQLELLCSYIDNKMNGEIKSYFPDGQLRYIAKIDKYNLFVPKYL